MTSWIKGGDETREIWVVRGATVGFGDSGVPIDSIDPQPNDNAHFWLSPDPWFEQSHYILLRAKDA